MTSRILSGAWRPGRSSNAIDRRRRDGLAISDASLILLLLSLGALTAVMHAAFHFPLRLPGHHGLEAMALMVFGRALTTRPWAATAVAAGAVAASLAPGITAWGPTGGWEYLLIGLAMDGLYRGGTESWRRSALFLAAIAALAHAVKPLFQWVLVEAFGAHFGSLQSGLLVPLGTHLVFGFAGGLAGALVAFATLRARDERG